MHRSSSKSMTVFLMRYGATHRIRIENCAPRYSRGGPPRRALTLPDPSNSGRWVGSASTSKTVGGPASTTIVWGTAWSRDAGTGLTLIPWLRGSYRPVAPLLLQEADVHVPLGEAESFV